MKKEITEKVLQEIETGYNRMARKFSETRKFFWRDLEFIGDYAEGNILDYGCGNGRLFELIKDKNIEYYGIDVSSDLINLAKEKYQNYPQAHFSKISAQEISLPFCGNFFNTAYSIAAFHHFPGNDYRNSAAQELYRIVKAEGHIIVAVWDLWQRKYRGKIMKNWMDKIMLKSELGWNDCHIKFKDNEGEIFDRYHHAFTKRELKKLFERAGFKTIKCEKLNKRNIIYIGRK